MSVIFCGGELEDFATVGAVLVDGTTTFYRTAYARCALLVPPNTWPGAYATASFAASPSVSVTARVYLNQSTFTANNPFFALSSGGVASARLRLKMTSATPSTIILESYNGTSATTLATSTLTVAAGVLYRLDVIVSYGAAGRVRVYIDQNLFIDTGTMDVTAAGSTTLNQAHFGAVRTATNNTYWSEIIVADEDTRPLSLKTLNPNGAGDVTEWTGAFTDIDEVTASDTDTASSAVAGQILTTESTGMPAGGSGEAIRAVKIVASALRGAAGPQKIAIGVKSGSSYGWSPDLPLDTGYTAVSHTLTADPATGQPFLREAITALRFALKSVA